MIDMRSPEGQLRQRFIGIAPFSVTSINPDLDGLRQIIGDSVEKVTPALGQNQQGKNYSRVDIWIHRDTEKINTKLSIFISEPKLSSTGKYKYIDKFGQSTIYYTEEELKNANFEREVQTGTKKGQKYTWFDLASARPMYEGEDSLCGFLRAWLGIKSTLECRLNSIENILKGDFSELQAFVEKAKDRKVICALGMNGEYYRVYVHSKGFMQPNKDNNYLKLADQIKKENYYQTNFGEYPYNWTAFVPSIDANNPTTDVSKGDLPF